MTTNSRFVIQNDMPGPVVVNVEPECVQFTLAPGENVTVYDTFEREPVTLRMESAGGETILSVWPGDGEVRVERDGVDVFKAIQKGACS
jgi:hypothetical protein